MSTKPDIAASTATDIITVATDVAAPIAVVQKNRREQLRFTLDEYKGHRFVTMRIYAPNRDGAMLPTKSGVTFKPALLPDVLAALHEVARRISEAAEAASR